MPRRVINTHEDADHVWGNQLFEGAEIIAHRSVPERMKQVAEPKESQKMLHGVGRLLTRLVLKALHPGIVAALFGGLHPLGTIPASWLFGALLVGADKMQRVVQVPSALIDTLLGLVVMLMVGSQMVWRKWARRHHEAQGPAR
jgi:hypothetical protein